MRVRGDGKNGGPVGRSLGQKPFHSLEDHLDVSGAGDFPGAARRRLMMRPEHGG